MKQLTAIALSIWAASALASVEDAERSYNQCQYEMSRIQAQLDKYSSWQTVQCHYFLDPCGKHDTDLLIHMDMGDFIGNKKILDAWRAAYVKKGNECMARLDRLEELKGE